jgi:hypothetical protein
LTGIVVGGEHQQVIYSLPHLRKITLQSACFQITELEIPKHNVSQIIFFNVPNAIALSHILRQTSSTLETLRVSDGVSEAFSLHTPQCPHLTVFTYINSLQNVNREVITFMERHPNILTVRLHISETFEHVGPSILPKLTKVTANGRLGRFLIARPELKEYYQHPHDDIKSVKRLWSWLVQVQPVPQLEQLRIALFCESDDFGALPVISHFFGKTLCRLHIWIENYSRDSRHDDFLLGGWAMLRGPRGHSQGQAIVKFARLRSIRVSFRIVTGMRFPEAACRELLRDRILPLCPALKEASFTALSSYKKIEQEEPEDGMELRIRKNGRGWDLPLQS